MEYKNILQNWKSFQTLRYTKKLKMENAYPCNLVYRGTTGTNYKLTFIHGQRLEARSGLITVTITIENFRGYSTEGRRITFVVGPDGEAPVILEFPNPEIHAAVLAEVEDFAGKRVNLVPSPPSTESSSSSDQDANNI